MAWTTNSFLKRLLGTAAISAALLTTAGAKELETRQVQISELISNSRSFKDQRVVVAGVLHLAPSSSPSVPQFIVVDNSGNAIPVTTWAPLEIPPSMPGNPSTNAVPETMRDFVGRKLSLTGDYRITADNTFQIVTDSAAAWISRDAAADTSAPVLPRGYRPQTITSPLNGTGAPEGLPSSPVVPFLKSGPPLSAKAKG